MDLAGKYLIFFGSAPRDSTILASIAFSVSNTTVYIPIFWAFPTIFWAIKLLPDALSPAKRVTRPFGIPPYNDPEITALSILLPVSIHSSTLERVDWSKKEE